MAHRSLALKYRPQVFSDLVGQEHVSAVLTRALENGRVAQAYLFTGARGVGKTTSARILAKALNCERRTKGADPCNACTSCTEITSGVSLDVAEIDGASNRGIADVQALREKVRFTPTGGRWRVVIIDEVHQLSNDAFAALLKTLEEPPAHLVFIFATTDPQKLPDTIRSRTQRFDFARVPLRRVAERLQTIRQREADDPDGTRFALTEGAALLIAQKSEGSMRDAVSALDQVVSAGEATIDEELVRRVLGIADREVFFRLVGAIVARDAKGALTALHEAFGQGLDPRDLVEGLTEHVRHLLVLRIDPQAEDLVAVTAEDLARLRGQTEGWTEQDLMRLLRIAAEAAEPMKESSHPLIHLEAAVLQMATLESGGTLAELLERLERLEQQLGGESPPPQGGPGPSGARPATAGARPAPPAVVPRPAPSSTGPRAGGPPEPGAGSSPVRSGAFADPARFSPPRAAAPAPMAATPAPAPQPVVAAAVATAVDEAPRLDTPALDSWREVLERVNARKRMLGAFLEESRFLGVGAGHLLVAMDDLHRAVVEEKENRALLAAEVTAVFGTRLEVRCTGLAPDAAPRRPSEQDLRPMIDRTIAWFEGDLVERPGTTRRGPDA